MLEVSLLGAGTVLRLERDAWSMVKRQGKQQRNTPPFPPPPSFPPSLRCFFLGVKARVLEVNFSEMMKPDSALTCCSVLLGGQPG